MGVDNSVPPRGSAGSDSRVARDLTLPWELPEEGPADGYRSEIQ